MVHKRSQNKLQDRKDRSFSKKKKGEWTFELPRVVTRSARSFSDLLDR